MLVPCNTSVTGSTGVSGGGANVSVTCLCPPNNLETQAHQINKGRGYSSDLFVATAESTNRHRTLSRNSLSKHRNFRVALFIGLAEGLGDEAGNNSEGSRRMHCGRG